MRVWTHNTFKGFYPVGSAAVIVAESSDLALELLNDELAHCGLTEPADIEGLEEVDLEKPNCTLLWDGDY